MRNSDGAERVRRFLRAQRKRHGWTQLDLAQRAHVAKNTVAALERGMALREGNEGAIEEALGLPLGTVEEVRRGQHPTEEPPALTDRQDQPVAPEPARTGLTDDERALIRSLSRRKWPAEDIAEALDELRRSSADQLSVEQRKETDRAHTEKSLGRLGETGTE